MRLFSLAVSHYRGFDSALIELPAAGIALVVGPNNAGKSALLAALDVVAGGKPGERMAREGSSERPRIVATFSLTGSERDSLFVDQAGQDPPATERWPAPWFQDWRLTFEAVSPDTSFMSGLDVRRGDQPGDFAALARQHFIDGQFSMERLNFNMLLGSNPAAASWALSDAGFRGGSGQDPFSHASALRHANLPAEWRSGYYHFEALRSGAPRKGPPRGDDSLAPNGENLPQALLHLSSNLDPAWDEIVDVMRVLVVPPTQVVNG